ncbi:MAG: hypothetical protein ABEI98_08560 [Halorhabdus sp.]
MSTCSNTNTGSIDSNHNVADGASSSGTIDARFLTENGAERPSRGNSAVLWFVYPEEFDAFRDGDLTLEELRERAELREEVAKSLAWTDGGDGHDE